MIGACFHRSNEGQHVFLKVDYVRLMQNNRLILTSTLAELVGAPSKTLTIRVYGKGMKLATSYFDAFLIDERFDQLR